MSDNECATPEDLPVMFVGPDVWDRLTHPSYHSYGLVHVHLYPDRTCSLTVTRRDS